MRGVCKQAQLTSRYFCGSFETMNVLADKASQDFVRLITGFMRQMFPHLEEAGLDFHILGNGLLGANTRIATPWVADRCKTPLETVLRNTLTLFKASIAYARAQEDAVAHARRASAACRARAQGSGHKGQRAGLRASQEEGHRGDVQLLDARAREFQDGQGVRLQQGACIGHVDLLGMATEQHGI